MAITTNQHYVNLYNSNVELLAMQTDNRLSKAVRNETQEGEYAFFNQIGAVGYTTISGIAESTVLNDPAHSRRRVGLARYSIVPYLDKADEVKMGWADPTSTYVQSSAATLNQLLDDVIIAAFDSVAYTDKTGSTTTSYDSTNDITVSGVLTVNAIARAAKILNANEVPTNDRYIALGASDIQTLLSDQNLTSSDFNTLKPLVSGQIGYYMGFTFIHSERLGSTGGANKIFFWQKNGLLLSKGAGPAGMFSRIDERTDLNYTKQLFTNVMCGATRMQESMVGRILRTPGV